MQRTDQFNTSQLFNLRSSQEVWVRAHHQVPRAAPSLSLCRVVINPAAELESGRQVAREWKDPQQRGKEGGDLQHPTDPVSSLLPLSAPRSPPWPNHGFLNNSACSSAIIWLFAGYWNMNNEGAERRPFPYFLSSWVCWQERTDGQTDTWTERWENDTDMLLLLFTVWVIFALIIYIVQWLWIKHSLIFYSAWRYQRTLAGLFSNLQTPICWLTDRYHTNILLIKTAAQTSWMTCTSQEAKLSVRVKNA